MMEGSLINIQYLQDILDNFCKATGLHVEMVNNKGEPFGLVDIAERCEFCEYIRSQPNGLKKCQASYIQASSEATKWEEPYFFRCRAGLVIWVVPIIINGASLGSIICGQVLLWKPDHFFYHELRKLNPEVEDFEELERMVKQLTIVTPDRFQAAADVLFMIVNQLMKHDLHILEKIGENKMKQQIHEALEERKKQKATTVRADIDYGIYFKRERSFLRFIRLGDKPQAEKSLQSLLPLLFIKTIGDQVTIKRRIIELASITSRAAVEGGAEAERVTTLLQQFYQRVDNSQQMEEFFFHLQQLVAAFLNHGQSLVDKKYNGLVSDAKKIIMESYSQNIKIEDVAAHLFISPSHLSRLFRQELGCTVNDYITRVRVEHAVELMKNPGLSVAQVSQSVGFQSQSYFAKVFSKYIGVAPLIYRNSLS
ncbi:PocR ligand-binding domain-containing protein [Sporomusa malonica]|uniref:Ligand-binding sensor domain-containing protein n=1 Tax=Sporomusa malonica TaxID=112901 RepID=A0A1W1Y747_9FIRM|nr:PocR ligand-binding domain-containing protein [Sporomusa malonica]SMC31944.1 Ligand-binding sensor domain-containing protein [Sporomusa malonica]